MVVDYADYSVGLIGNSHFFGCVVCAVIKCSPWSLLIQVQSTTVLQYYCYAYIVDCYHITVYQVLRLIQLVATYYTVLQYYEYRRRKTV